MPVPSSGPVAISDLVDEFGGTAPHSLSEYYRNGSNVPGNNTNVPTAGAFGLSNARGAVNEIAVAATSGANIDIATLFGANWTSTVPKRLTIGSGVTIGGTGSSAAIIIPSNMAGTLEIDNAGDIIGFGGAAGAAGGTAISNLASGVTINNTGLLAGGGGGGGNGGNGGNGSYSSTSNSTQGPNGGYHWTITPYQAKWAYVALIGCGGSGSSCSNGGNTYSRVGGGVYGAVFSEEVSYAIRRTSTTTVNTSGGSGGSGGVGQGYTQTNASGASGASGGTNAGTGGTGGAGATYGNAGSTGSTGANGNSTNGSAGSAGGAAGAAVTGTTVTMNNTGTLYGAVA